MSSSPSRGWRLHGDGRSIAPGEVVAPGERLTWPRTIGIGVQHVVAMFGATFLVPLLTGFDPATTLFFTGVGTLLFLGITSGRLPSYLGSSFALLAPIGAVTGYTRDSGAPLDPHKAALAQGGIISVGLCLLVVGIIVHLVGSAWIDRLMPPIVTGAIVSLIGFNLAPSAWNNVKQAPVTAVVTIVSILLITVMFKGIIGRLAILIGVLIGYVTAVLRGEVHFDKVAKAPVLGLPDFHAPAFDVRYLGLFIPVVLVLIAENIGHVKSVSAMTGEDLDDVGGVLEGRRRGGAGEGQGVGQGQAALGPLTGFQDHGVPTGGDHLPGEVVHEPTSEPGPGRGGRLTEGGLHHLVTEPAARVDTGGHPLGQASPGRGQLGPGQVDGVEDVVSAGARMAAGGGVQELLLGDPLQVPGRSLRLPRLVATGALGLQLAQ